MNKNKIRVLAVDDDSRLRKILQSYLEEEGFYSLSAKDGDEMKEILSSQSVDLVILAVMLPGDDGLSLARKLRTQYSIPIIMLSAKGKDIDRIIGLEVGADDYISKPFNPRELIARIRAVLRRTEDNKDQNNHPPTNIHNYRFGPFLLDTVMHTLYRNDQQVQLTTADYKLLSIFLKHSNKVLNRDHLLDLLKGYEHVPFDRSIDQRIFRLRQKIEENPADPRYIRTIWGEGYILSVPVEVE
ncbi:response regulator [Sedimenticola selenatireducens]|uniref:Two-component system response regulator OmpR n=1 Tax=Sedimenticola selenatireducens TaxID=191960 RepID=A0A2N6CUX8_9GAMM|nr:response regulator [Sedimenticola selenatireducens]PLX60986.1 MAG: two-component system response regulator OmpR [Sedimenticola selenatireducens]